MEHTFEELSIETMSMSQLEQLKDSIDEEIASRREKERKEAEKEIYNLLATIQELCNKYNIDLYDEHDNLVYFDEITT